MITLETAAISLAAVGSGLMAGVFFAFSSFVMGALGQVSAPAGMAAMQAINITVINKSFLGTFIGTAIVCALILVGMPLGQIQPSPMVIAGCLFYLIGTFGVTAAFNVPRNDRLEKMEAEDEEGQRYWRIYLKEWTFWNTVRTVCALVALVLFLVR